MKSIHPYEPFIPNGATKLIIGTIPPPRFCNSESNLFEDDVNFYYGSRDNYFWPLLEEIFGENLEYNNSQQAIIQRKMLLEKLNIGITDIVAECIHKNKSATDDNLDEASYKDIKKLLDDNPNLETLIYTSEYVKKLVNNYFNTYHSIDPLNKKIQSVKIGSKKYDVRILLSPSPMALMNMGEGGKIRRMDQYRSFLST
jgi:G:T/U-mismatch repair DNA glycosylase